MDGQQLRKRSPRLLDEAVHLLDPTLRRQVDEALALLVVCREARQGVEGGPLRQPREVHILGKGAADRARSGNEVLELVALGLDEERLIQLPAHGCGDAVHDRGGVLGQDVGVVGRLIAHAALLQVHLDVLCAAGVGGLAELGVLADGDFSDAVVAEEVLRAAGNLALAEASRLAFAAVDFQELDGVQQLRHFQRVGRGAAAAGLELLHQAGPQLLLPVLEVIFELIVIVALAKRIHLLRAELQQALVALSAGRVEMLVLGVPQREGCDLHVLQDRAVLLLDPLVHPAEELDGVVGGISLPVRGNEKDGLVRGGELLGVEVFEVHHMGIEAQLAALVAEGIREALCCAGLRAKVEKQIPARELGALIGVRCSGALRPLRSAGAGEHETHRQGRDQQHYAHGGSWSP
mmetsp:Transcript_19275/g.72842  ORF Transcript_19275/g.72842 Transcript_19275/m.72842 type:complete len:406 (+) Transcript_19275:1082-2299(+)